MSRFYREPLLLDDRTRAGLPGQFIRLPEGVTHYELTGPEAGQAVVLVHGFSTPLFLWDPTAPALAEAGLRVLRYDLFGRGYSDRPGGPYTLDRFDRQLLDLLDALGLTAPVDLVGLSMGGAIVGAFCARHPERVRRLALLDPAGYPLPVSPGAAALFVPGLGELLMAVAGDRIMVGGLPHDFLHPERYPDYYARYREQMPYRGFKRAVLSTMRRMPLTRMDAVYRQVGKQNRPVLLLWGQEDRTIPFATSQKVLAAIPNAEFHAIPEAAHLPQYERPEAVNPILIEFFRRA